MDRFISSTSTNPIRRSLSFSGHSSALRASTFPCSLFCIRLQSSTTQSLISNSVSSSVTLALSFSMESATFSVALAMALSYTSFFVWSMALSTACSIRSFHCVVSCPASFRGAPCDIVSPARFASSCLSTARLRSSTVCTTDSSSSDSTFCKSWYLLWNCWCLKLLGFSACACIIRMRRSASGFPTRSGKSSRTRARLHSTLEVTIRAWSSSPSVTSFVLRMLGYRFGGGASGAVSGCTASSSRSVSPPSAPGRMIFLLCSRREMGSPVVVCCAATPSSIRLPSKKRWTRASLSAACTRYFFAAPPLCRGGATAAPCPPSLPTIHPSSPLPNEVQ
eukprot:Sspe_Gene.71508::Locus_42417_Transcript_1_1_Confidence_1.000_Length_4625::g.71508::m.71508